MVVPDCWTLGQYALGIREALRTPGLDRVQFARRGRRHLQQLALVGPLEQIIRGRSADKDNLAGRSLNCLGFLLCGDGDGR